MLANEFIDKLLEKLAFMSFRLQDSMTRLQIQFEMQNLQVLEYINYFISIIPEYKHKWQQIATRQEYYQDIELVYIYTLPQFQELCNFLQARKLLLDSEILWLDDAIHEVIIES